MKYSFDSPVNFKAKRYLGHLISRNFIHTGLNFINKLTDYLLFYSDMTESTFSSQNLNETQINLILSIVEPCINIVRVMLKSLIKNQKFEDITPLSKLFKFYGVFSYCSNASLENVSHNYLVKRRIDSLNKKIVDICISYTGKAISFYM